MSVEGAEAIDNLEVLLARLFAEVVEAPPGVVPEGFAPEAPADTTAKEADRSSDRVQGLAAEGANGPGSSKDPPSQAPPPSVAAPVAKGAGHRAVPRIAEGAGLLDRPRGAGLYCTSFAGGSLASTRTRMHTRKAGSRRSAATLLNMGYTAGSPETKNETKNEPKHADRTPAQGRPLGLLAAWLEQAHSPNMGTATVSRITSRGAKRTRIHLLLISPNAHRMCSPKHLMSHSQPPRRRMKKGLD